MISGKSFYEKCKWNLCNRYPIKFNIQDIKNDDFLFINLDTIYHVISFLDKSKFDKKVNIITHNSDLSFTNDMFLKIKKYVNKVYAINSIIKDDNMVKIPLGFSDRLVDVISSMMYSNDKKYLMYINFNIHSGRIPERVECRDYFKKFNWVKFEDLVPEHQYYENLMLSKYSACPIGAGLDTHRFYESIYFNTIPIVKRNDISDLYLKFPCIIVDNWDEIIYQELVDGYQNNLDNLVKWKENNDWLNPDFWMKINENK